MSNGRVPVHVEIGAGLVAEQLAQAEPRDWDQASAIAFAAAVSSVAWLAADAGDQFKIGVGGLLLYYLSRDQHLVERIQREMRILAGHSASMSGVPVDWRSVWEREGDEAPLGLVGLFRRAREDVEGDPLVPRPPAKASHARSSAGVLVPLLGVLVPLLGEKRRAACGPCGRRLRVFLGRETAWRCLTCGGDRPWIEDRGED